MKKLLSTITAALFAATGAFAANVGSVDIKSGTLSADGTTYTATALEYKASPSNDSAPYRTQTGWYAGIKLNWNSQTQNAKETKASVSDGDGMNKVTEYTVYNNGDKTPSGSGMKNEITTSGSIFSRKYWMSTTEWYIYVTPEFMYSLNGADYSATLTIGDNTYTITVPNKIVLSDGSHQWYPAVGLLGEKVYGEAQYLADQIALDNYTTVKFLSDPSNLTFPTGFKADVQGGDGKWGVALDHQHNWAFAVSNEGSTLTATCGSAGCPYETTTVSLTLTSGDKVYDGKTITAAADFDDYFEDIFPDGTTAISIEKDGEPAETINDAGTYTVTMTVTGLGDNQTHELNAAVSITQKDITGATLVLSPATMTYNAAEQSVTPSVTVDGLAATLEATAESTLAATEIGEYSVTVNGIGNFTGTASGTWEIKNTTGAINGVAPTTSETAGSYAGNTLTVTDTTALAYEDGAWTAGITLTWPMESSSPALGNGHAYYVKPETMQMTIGETVYTGREIADNEAVYEVGKLDAEVKDGSYTYYSGLSRKTQNFSYLYDTTWKVALTPAAVEAAIAESKTELAYAMNAGAIIWGNSTEGDPDGVAFADYTIALSLGEPVTFVLGEGQSHDLGETVLTTTRIKLLPGASVTSSVAQTAEGAIYTEATGYEVGCSEVGGVYTYSTLFTHEHAWTIEVVDGTNLVATCGNDDCDLGGEVKMRLDVATTEKAYDGVAVEPKASFEDGFEAQFPDMSATLTVNEFEVEDCELIDAGEYVILLTVTGLGDDETYLLSTTVTINTVDISEATLVFTPASTTYNGEAQTVAPSVTVGGATATLGNGLELVEGTCVAADIGEYSVTVNGAGNFSGTATGKWEIKNTTGSLKSVTPTANGIGEYDNENNTLTITDSTALEYSDGAWNAGITLEWPVNFLNPTVFVKRDTIQVTVDEVAYTGEQIINGETSYSKGKLEVDEFRRDIGIEIAYLQTTTWKVRITPEIIEAALKNNDANLDYTMNAGAFAWSETYDVLFLHLDYGNPEGVEFKDYTITIPLENVVFALAEGETHDLGDTMLTTTRIKLAPGASVTSSVEQTAEGAIYPADPTSYQIICSEVDDKFVYTTQHIHNWNSVAVANNGYELVATCSNDGCDEPDGKVVMTLSIEDKIYDGTAITASAVYAEDFSDVFPDVDVQNVGTQISVTKDDETVDAIMDAGEYVVTMTVTGLENEQNYTLTRTVTVNPLNIENTTLVLEPLTQTYTGNELSVTPSVTVGGFTLTLGNGLEMIEGTCTATEIGEYTVTVYGTGNFTGTPPSATWEIVASSSELTIIEEIKADIADEVSGETAESAKAKIDILAGVAGEGNEQEVAAWVTAQKGDNAAEFYTALAQSEYVKASFELDTALITADSDVSISEFVDAEDGFTFAVKIGDDDIEAARVKATRIIMTATALDSTFAQLDAARIVIPESGVEGEAVEMTVTKAPNATTEFFKVVIPKDE